MAMFEAYAETGQLQFSAEVFTFGFIGKSVMSFTEVYPGGVFLPSTVYGYTTGFAESVAPMALVAWSSFNRPIDIWSEVMFDSLSSTYKSKAWCPRPVPNGSSTAPRSTPSDINLWKFARYKELPIGENFGLELYNAGAERTYHSSIKPARVAHVHPINSAADIRAVTLPTGRTYAHYGVGLVRPPNPAPLNPNGANYPQIRSYGVISTANGYNFQEMQPGGNFSVDWTYQLTAGGTYNGAVISLDVTGY